MRKQLPGRMQITAFKLHTNDFIAW